MQKAGNDTCQSVFVAKYKATKTSATEVPPPRDEPFRQLERSQAVNRSSELGPFLFYFEQAGYVFDNFQIQGGPSQADAVSAAQLASSSRNASR